MLGYLEFLSQHCNIPIGFIIVIIVFFTISNIIGELLEFKGKVVPEFIKFRKYFARKKRERETLAAMPDMMENLSSVPEMLDNVHKLLNDVDQHYSSDNIAMRNKWIDAVNSRLDCNESVIKEINEKIDKNSQDIANLSQDVIDLLLDRKRETIISFAEKVCDDTFPATREQFTRIFKIYEEYERIISERGLTNGEIDVAHKIINESYQVRLKNHTFIEDVRWHGLEQ